MSRQRFRAITPGVAHRVTYWAGSTWRRGQIVSGTVGKDYTILGDDGSYYYGLRRREIRLAGEAHGPR